MFQPVELVIAGWTGRDQAARCSAWSWNPVLKRRLKHEYRVKVLPVEG